MLDIDRDRSDSDLWEQFLAFAPERRPTQIVVQEPVLEPIKYTPANENDLKPEHVRDVENILNCKIERNIGQGGFANVKLIRTIGQNKEMAIKIVTF